MIARYDEEVSKAVRGDTIETKLTVPPVRLAKIYHAKVDRIDLVNGFPESGSGIKHMSKRVVGQPVETGKAGRPS